MTLEIMDRAGLTNVGALFENKICGAYPPNQNERPNDRVLLIFVIQFQCQFLYTVVHTF